MFVSVCFISFCLFIFSGVICLPFSSHSVVHTLQLATDSLGSRFVMVALINLKSWPNGLKSRCILKLGSTCDTVWPALRALALT